MLKKHVIGTVKNQDISENQAKSRYAFLSLGSNLESKFGDRKQNLEIAKSYLLENKIKIINKSNYYESFAQPNEKDPKFINCVIKIETDLKAEKLMELLLDIEKKLGRARLKKNEPRVCDIDIIDYNGECFEIGNLKIPHKESQFRNFVLIPLNEINPEWIHPENKINIQLLLKKLKDSDINSIKKV